MTVLRPIALAAQHGVGAPRFILPFLHKDNAAKQPLAPKYQERAALALSECLDRHSFSADDVVAAKVPEAIAALVGREQAVDEQGNVNTDAHSAQSCDAAGGCQQAALAAVRALAQRSTHVDDAVSQKFEELKIPQRVVHVMLHTDVVTAKRSAAEALEMMTRPPHDHLASRGILKWQVRLAFERVALQDMLAERWARMAIPRLPKPPPGSSLPADEDPDRKER